MEHEAFYQNPTFWVAMAFVLFVVLSYKKASKLLINALDARSARIAVELNAAKRLREEAEAVLAEYRRKQAESLKEAESIIAKARQDADAYSKQAEQELKVAMETRTKQALEKITLAEDKAIQDVRNHVVDIALAAARAIIVENVGTLSQDELIKLALSDIERKVH